MHNGYIKLDTLLPKLRLAESRIVIHPSADYRVYPLCYLLYAQMRPSIQIPTANLSLYLQHRLLAYRRTECSKDLPCLAVFGFARSEGVTQEIKGCMLRVTLAVTILTINYLGLLFIQFQPAVCKPFYQTCTQRFSLQRSIALAMALCADLIGR